MNPATPPSACARPDLAPLHALRDCYRQDKAALLATLQGSGASTRGIRSLLRALSTLADRLLCQLWRRAGLPEAMALVAVGGYGRAQLFPYSDVDVLVLLPDDAEVPRAAIEAFIGSCWDAGLEIGSSVRTVAECLSEAAADVTVQTSLLESRLLCGSAALFAGFRQRYDAQMDPRAFLTAKTLEMRQRHTKYENTPYALEPNCKESPGGLRAPPAWAAPGARWRKAGWPRLSRCARSSATRRCCSSSARACTRWRDGARTGWYSICRPPWPSPSATAPPRPTASAWPCAPARR
jgi:[protein-PII] uridylyltransferase